MLVLFTEHRPPPSIDGLDHLLVVANFKAALTRPVSRMNFVLAGHVVKTSCYKNVENKSPKSISEVKQPHCLTSFTSFGLPQRLKFFRKMLTQIPAFIRMPIRVSIPLLSLSRLLRMDWIDPRVLCLAFRK